MMDSASTDMLITQLADRYLQLVDTAVYTPELYQVYLRRGKAHHQMGNYEEALSNHHRANRIAHTRQDSFGIAQSGYRIADVQISLKMLEPARRQLEQALIIFSHLDSTRWVAYAFNALGTIEGEEENWEQALTYYQRSFELLEAAGLVHLSSIPLNNIADVYYHQRQYERSLGIFRQSLMLEEANGTPSGLAIAHLNIGSCLMALGDYSTALQEMKTGLRIAQRYGLRRVATAIYEELAKTYQRAQLADSAMVYLQKHIDLKDSLLSSETSARLEEMYVAYETEKTQNIAERQRSEITLLKQQRKISQLTNYAVIISLLFIIFIVAFFLIRYRMNQQLTESDLRNQRLKTEQMERELATKQQDLTNLALEIGRRNEIFNEYNEALRRIRTGGLNDKGIKQLDQLIRYNTQQLRINEDLEELQVNIEQVNADFFAKLNELSPDLTKTERQLCALMRLGLSTKDIASIRNISPKSVEMARYRLRKKLGLSAEVDIYQYVQQI